MSKIYTEQLFYDMYEWIFDYYSEKLFMPSIRQIKRGLDIGSTQTVYRVLTELENSNLIIKQDNGMRRLSKDDMIEAIKHNKLES